jgi:aryl-alcohol dehydrogenase-like predicted oxidoreductase
VLAQPGVTAPIVGASKMDQLEQAVAALEIALTDDDRKRLEELYEPHPVLM